MLTLNACACPRCHYFLGYSTTRPDFNNRRSSLIGSCLNCDYRLPIHAIVSGTKTLAKQRRIGRSNLRLIEGQSVGLAPIAPTLRQRRMAQGNSKAASQNYGRDLRAVGQALDRLNLTSFSLKRAGESYFIWIQYHAQAKPLQRTFGSFTTRTPPMVPAFRLNPDDIARIEYAGQLRRQKTLSVSNGRKLTHMLRTLGEYINGRGERLLGITWREPNVSVVIETAEGRRQIEEFRSDFLSDLWVRMYLRRAH